MSGVGFQALIGSDEKIKINQLKCKEGKETLLGLVMIRVGINGLAKGETDLCSLNV